jgi:LemA protein
MRKFLITLIATLSLSGCGYNDFQRQDEGVKAAWSEVLNNYQRRADLIPNLVATVQGAADFEKSTLVELTNARASVGAIKATPELVNDPEGFAKFQAAFYSSTMLIHMITGSAETLTRLPPSAPLVTAANASIFKGVIGALILLFLAGLALQLRWLRGRLHSGP